MRGRPLLALMACLSVSIALAAQAPPTPQPTFRAGVRVVEIDAVVRDEDDDFVAGLTEGDFEVLEDGVSQEVFSVTAVNLPTDRRGPVEAEAGAGAAALSSTAPLDEIGRVYVMVLNVGNPVLIRGVARQFVEEFLGPTDLMAVMHGDRAATPGLTNDKEVLVAAVERFTAGRGNGLATLKEVAVSLNAMRGRRKAILFFQDNGVLDRAFWAPEGTPETQAHRQARREWGDIARFAVRNGVRIYPIGPVDPRIGPGPPGSVVASRIVAAETGAIAIMNTSNYGGNFRRIVRDHSAYYVVAFSSSAADDGKMHRVQVRVKGRPDLSVRTRSGYQAPTPDVKGRSAKLPKNLSATAKSSLTNSFVGTAGLPIEILTTVFRGEGFDGSVLIACHVPGKGLTLAPKDQIELSYVAVDRWGTVRAAERRAFTLTFSESMRARVEQTGVRLFGRLRLPRGSYEIRVVAHQPSGATGVARAQVEIPDYTLLPMSISELVVASSRGPTLLTLEDDAVLRRALTTQPTPRRRFAPSETVSVFGEIYNAQWVLSQQIGVTTIVRSADGRVVARGEDSLAAAERGRAYFNGRLPLDRLPPGEYAMILEAYTRHGIPASASQELRFEIAKEP